MVLPAANAQQEPQEPWLLTLGTKAALMLLSFNLQSMAVITYCPTMGWS